MSFMIETSAQMQGEFPIFRLFPLHKSAVCDKIVAVE